MIIDKVCALFKKLLQGTTDMLEAGESNLESTHPKMNLSLWYYKDKE